MIDQKLIKAPFAGQLGIRQVELGQYVSPGTTLVTLTDLDKLYVNFTLPEQDRAAARRSGQPVEIRVDAFPGGLPGQADDDRAAGRSRRRARSSCRRRWPTPGHLLLPGMFANARVVLPPDADVVTRAGDRRRPDALWRFGVRREGGGKGTDGKPKQKAVQTFVETGPAYDGRIAIPRASSPASWW